MRLPIQTALLVGLASAPFFTLACASRMMQRRHYFSAAELRDVLALDKDQEEKLAAALKDERTSTEPLLEKQRQTMRLLNDELKIKAPEQDLQSALSELELAHVAARATEEDFWEDVSAFLSPTQRAKLLMLRSMSPEGQRGTARSKARRRQPKRDRQ